MDGFTYHDIFQTKGVEYLVIIAFLVLLVPFWIFVNKQSNIPKKVIETIRALTMDILKIPKGIFFNRNHTWAYLEKSGIAEVGLDDLLFHLTGDVKFGNLKQIGESIKKGELLAELVQNGKTLQVYSPISGDVIATNPLTHENPSLIKKDPFQQGWVYRIAPSNWKAETSYCYFGDDASSWFIKEMERFKDFIAVSIGRNSQETSMVILQEGGELCDNPLSELPGSVWMDFQHEFLDIDK